ncbi:hypothetical protein CPU12_10455 [Malaciobacter molluscorum LMG 25693]|uniref:Antitoxin n=1 Tax=Malaciobacter molluscorum LMG 25693 TaxID=870501 RepID=A0A2G1DG29_9BACT|nr:hypothetical protein [Malaciobacter molluscorum]AXX91096.1 hypothetical protein AMOL_0055 [Malaciobacter molluscorum LMG 25693]PHO17458.1 hypothetical protein CPU12_10455 [Malaciobacter molluscorum LMG 25693]
MNYLQYTSKEMYSSTELIRKSKYIFEKLNKKEIEKAVILRDGKPSFMLLDFESYEKIMEEYMNLKNSNLNVQNENQSKNKIQKVNEEKIEIQPQTQESLDEQELKKALDEIDNISFDDIISKDKDKDEDLEEVYIEERPIDKNEKSLKEFWE